MSPSMLCTSHDSRDECDIETPDDGSVRVHGTLPSVERAKLELTHFDTGALIGGWTVWMPLEIDNDRD